MNPDYAHELWKTQTEGDEYRAGEPPATKPVPQFSTGNGGRVRLQGYFSRVVLEALIAMGRDQVPTNENSPTPTTEAEAFAILQAKTSGNFNPHLSHSLAESLQALERLGTGSLAIEGETRLPELEAAHLLWCAATERDAPPPRDLQATSVDEPPVAITPITGHLLEGTGMGVIAADPVASEPEREQTRHDNETAIVAEPVGERGRTSSFVPFDESGYYERTPSTPSATSSIAATDSPIDTGSSYSPNPTSFD